MFDCCSRKKPSKTSLIDQLRYTTPINLGLSERINLVFDEENKRWKSDQVDLHTPLVENRAAPPIQASQPNLMTSSNLASSNPSLGRSHSPTAQQQRLRQLKQEAAEAQRALATIKKKHENFERKKLTIQLTNRLLEKMALDERIAIEKQVGDLEV